MAEMYNVARCNAYQGHCEMCKEENGGQCANWWWHEKWNNNLDWQSEDEALTENQQAEIYNGDTDGDTWPEFVDNAEGKKVKLSDCKITRYPKVGLFCNKATAAMKDTFDFVLLRFVQRDIDAPKITRRPTKRNFQDAYIYAIREDVDGEFPYETEITHKMAGWLNMNGFDVNFDEIKMFVENHKHF